jgi:AraC-like DNA-binding protein
MSSSHLSSFSQHVHQTHTGPSCTSSVIASVTVGLDAFIDAQGGQSQEVMARAGLLPDLHKQPNRHISLNHYIASMHEAAKSTGNEHFGLWFGEQFQPEGLGAFGFYAMTSGTLRDALAGMQAYFPVFQRNSVLQLDTHQGICELEYRLLDGDIMDRRQDAELTLGMLNNVVKHAMGEQWSPLGVDFQHPALVDANPHRTAFCCDVRFQQARNVIRFRESCLDQPMAKADPMLNGVLVGMLQEMASQPLAPISMTQRVKSEIIECLPSGDISIECVAKRLNQPVRSLQRRLKEENSSFKTLTETVREDLATYYLNYNTLTVSEIAYRLGYSEVSAFTRAFLRWKGINPTQWRMA